MRSMSVRLVAFGPVSSQIHGLPVSSRSTEVISPAEISTIFGIFVIILGTGIKEKLLITFLNPSWPFELNPLDHTFPSISKNIEWEFPAETEAIGIGKSIFTGVDWFLLQSETCPYMLLPDPHTVPSSSSNNKCLDPADTDRILGIVFIFWGMICLLMCPNPI